MGIKLPGSEINRTLRENLKEQVSELKKKGHTPTLVTILIGESSEQLSFVKIKRLVAEKIGANFEFVHVKKAPSFQEFAELLKKHSMNPKVNGIIVQQPLPSRLQTDSVYNFIPLKKEVEGHKPKSPFHPPLGLAVLTALKYYYTNKIDQSLFIKSKEDCDFFRKNLKRKKIVLVGRGVTGGQPIGKTLNSLKINYLSINSRTYTPEEYYKDADIIITASGKKIIKPEIIKPGVILLNVGLRKEGEVLKGDYDEDEIKDIAGFYTPTPGGIGPIDVLYLFKNLIDATRLQI